MWDHDEIFEYNNKHYRKTHKKDLQSCDGCAFEGFSCSLIMAQCERDKVIYVEMDPMLVVILEVKESAEEENNAGT